MVIWEPPKGQRLKRTVACTQCGVCFPSVPTFSIKAFHAGTVLCRLPWQKLALGLTFPVPALPGAGGWARLAGDSSWLDQKLLCTGVVPSTHWDHSQPPAILQRGGVVLIILLFFQLQKWLCLFSIIQTLQKYYNSESVNFQWYHSQRWYPLLVAWYASF